jgi:hypothetical protein
MLTPRSISAQLAGSGTAGDRAEETTEAIVPVKTLAQQDLQALHRIRERNTPLTFSAKP